MLALPPEWLSVHMFFERGPLYGGAADDVILNVVTPAVQTARSHAWILRYFFIRYGEGGPHVRLRFLGSRAVLETRLWPLICRLAEEMRADHVCGSVRPVRIPYEPELDRYGRDEGMVLAERFFESSSDAVLVLLRRLAPNDRPARFGAGLLVMMGLVQAFFPERASAVRILRSYGTGLLTSLRHREGTAERLARAFDSGFVRQAAHLTRYVEEVWARLEADDAVSEALDPYVASARALAADVDRLPATGVHVQRNESGRSHARRRLAPSFLHMTNNRLGLSIAEEAYLAALIGRTLTERVSSLV